MQTLKLGNIEFEGLNNAYMLETAEATTLVGTVVGTNEVPDQLHEELWANVTGFYNIDVVFLTHRYPDHAGLAETIQNSSGATVYAPRIGALPVKWQQDVQHDMPVRQVERFDSGPFQRTSRLSCYSTLKAGI